MEKTTTQIEKNVAASFGYVKKDLLMVNDSLSDLQDKISHLSINHADLLSEIEKIRNQISEKKVKSTKKVSKVKKKKVSNKKKVKKTISKSPKKIVKETVVY